MKPSFLLLFLFSSLLLGCGKGGDGAQAAAADGAAALEACDAYVARLEACARKAPVETWAAHEASIGAARDVFEEKAQSDGDKVALSEACKQMALALAERPMCN